MNLVLFRHHVSVLLRRRRLIGLIALALVPVLLIAGEGLAVEMSATSLAEIAADGTGSTFAIAALILGAATWRDERDGGTLPYLYLKPVSRLSMATTSVLAATAATALLGIVAAAGIVIAALVVDVDLGPALASFPLYAAASLGYSALFVPLGYLLSRAVLTGLAYIILWEQVVARVVPGVANTSISRFAVSIYADLTGLPLEGALGPVAPGAWGGLAKIGVVAVAGIAALTWALNRRDAV